MRPRDGKVRTKLTLKVTQESIDQAQKKATEEEPPTNISGWFEKKAAE